MEPVESLIERVCEAWNRGDAAAYAACYAEDATYVNRAGELIEGRAAIERSHRAAFEGPLKGSMLAARVRRDVPLSPSVRIVHVEVELSGGEVPLWAVSLFVVQDGWIQAAQTTEI